MLLSSRGRRGPFLQTANHCGKAVSISLPSLTPKVRMTLPHLPDSATVQKYKVLTVKGVTYRKGSPIATSMQGIPAFGKVVNLLKVNNDLVFVYQKFVSVKFVNSLNSFQVRHSSEFEVIKVNDLPYNHALILIQQTGCCYVTVPYRSYLSSLVRQLVLNFF